METVEDLVIAVAAYLVVMVDESVMYVLSRHEFRKDGIVLGENGLESLELGLLVSVYPDPIARFETLPYIFRKQLEILIERRLRGYVEF